ncbi:Uncharacterised protein [Haemophilus influenzae]|uniref:Uncharacterized protein n=1 Tax=Haemophilus influenzae TaxID=727 RepID=A0A2X1PM36_HAEIF|nr:Uncharacterised protein [Haemophilus influenzae]
MDNKSIAKASYSSACFSLLDIMFLKYSIRVQVHLYVYSLISDILSFSLVLQVNAPCAC